MGIEIRDSWSEYHAIIPLEKNLDTLITQVPLTYCVTDCEDLVVMRIGMEDDYFIVCNKVARLEINQEKISSSILEWMQGKDFEKGKHYTLIVDRIQSIPIFDVTSKQIIDWDSFSYYPPKDVKATLMLASMEDGYIPKKIYNSAGNTSALFSRVESEGLIIPHQPIYYGEMVTLDLICGFNYIDQISPANFSISLQPGEVDDNLISEQRAALVKFKNKIEDKGNQRSNGFALPPLVLPAQTYVDDEWSVSIDGKRMVRLSWIVKNRNIPYTKDYTFIDRDIPMSGAQEKNTDMMAICVGKLYVSVLDTLIVSSTEIATFLGIPFGLVTITRAAFKH